MVPIGLSLQPHPSVSASSIPTGEHSPCPPRAYLNVKAPKYQSKFAQIDGKGGTVEAAIEDTVVDGCVIEPE